MKKEDWSTSFRESLNAPVLAWGGSICLRECWPYLGCTGKSNDIKMETRWKRTTNQMWKICSRNVLGIYISIGSTRQSCDLEYSMLQYEPIFVCTCIKAIFLALRRYRTSIKFRIGTYIRISRKRQHAALVSLTYSPHIPTRNTMVVAGDYYHYWHCYYWYCRCWMMLDHM